LQTEADFYGCLARSSATHIIFAMGARSPGVGVYCWSEAWSPTSSWTIWHLEEKELVSD